MFTKEELIFINNVFTQLTWKTGQSKEMILSETICKKIAESQEEKKKK